MACLDFFKDFYNDYYLDSEKYAKHIGLVLEVAQHLLGVVKETKNMDAVNEVLELYKLLCSKYSSGITFHKGILESLAALWRNELQTPETQGSSEIAKQSLIRVLSQIIAVKTSN